jgi:hypothetical protein
MDVEPGFVSEATEELPSKEECWNAFWAALAPGLVELHQRGLLPTEPYDERLVPPSLPEGFHPEYSDRDVRNWARASGRPVNRMGRLPYRLLEEYEGALSFQILDSGRDGSEHLDQPGRLTPADSVETIELAVWPD